MWKKGRTSYLAISDGAYKTRSPMTGQQRVFRTEFSVELWITVNCCVKFAIPNVDFLIL